MKAANQTVAAAVSGILKPAYSYARFSDKKQKQVSIEDQERICDELAAAHGCYIPPQNRFRDEAIQGSANREDRPGWNALCNLIESGAVRFLFADEHTRLFRSVRESVDIQEQIVLHKMMVVCRDFSTAGEWELLWGIKSALGVDEIRKISARIMRAQKGLVASGKATGAVSYGYARNPVYNEQGNREYTLYAIDPMTSLIVKRMYAERKSGVSCAQIARNLNMDGIPTPGGGTLWHRALVAPLMRRPIYKGVQKYGQNSNYHPHLALVSEADWDLVQPKSKGFSATGRGGGKYWATGIVSCGVCGAPMTAAATKSSQVIFCNPCRMRRNAGATERGAPMCVLPLVKLALCLGMQLILTPERMAGYREAILQTRDRSADGEIEILNERIALIDRGLKRLVNSIVAINDEAAVKPFEEEACALRDDRSALALKVAQLKRSGSNVNKTDLDKQLQVDPRTLVPKLFSGNMPAWELRSLLCRIFPQIVLERQSFTERCFTVTISPGLLFSTPSDTPTIEMPRQSYKVRVLNAKRGSPTVELVGQVETPVLPERTDVRLGAHKEERQKVLKAWRQSQESEKPQTTSAS